MPDNSARRTDWETTVEKVALFSLHPVARVITSFAIGLAPRRNVRFFGDVQAARAWLTK